jgi:hypothetical protein
MSRALSNLLGRLPWPLPALLAWAGAFSLWRAALGAGAHPAAAWVGAAVVGVVLAWANPGLWRRVLAAAGFPLATAVLGAVPAMPPWAWLAALLPLLVLYPVHAWRDAPLFPTPPGALDGLAALIGQPPPRRVLDAGCGAGDGLLGLREQWPQAGMQIEGIEYSRVLALACRARCRFARVAHGNLWAQDWAGFDLVYLFQRPESMARAWAKAGREMKPGAWLVSLEFEVPGAAPQAVLRGANRRPVWLYRVAGARGSNNAVAGR